MPIALTAVLAPSRRLRLLVGAAGACPLAAACAVALAAPATYAAQPLVAAALLFAGICVTHAALRPGMVHRIDISGPGQLRLTVQQGVRPDESGTRAARLLAGSTRWPGLLVLRLELAVDAPVGALPAPAWRRLADRRGPARLALAVLPDSLPPDAFRALAVAVGALAGVGGASSTEREIL